MLIAVAVLVISRLTIAVMQHCRHRGGLHQGEKQDIARPNFRSNKAVRPTNLMNALEREMMSIPNNPGTNSRAQCPCRCSMVPKLKLGT